MPTREEVIAELQKRGLPVPIEASNNAPTRESVLAELKKRGLPVPGQGWGAVGKDIGNRVAEFAGDIGHMFMHPIESTKQTYGMGKEINAGLEQLEHARGKKNLFAGLEQFGRGVLNTPAI